jgi:hypothetical protein
MHENRWRRGKNLTAPLKRSKFGRGRTLVRGYIQTTVPKETPGAKKHTQANVWYMYEHRYIMQNYLGRALLPSEGVHHKDGNKTNNAIENLELRRINHGPGIAIIDGIAAAFKFLKQYGDLLPHESSALKQIEARIFNHAAQLVTVMP